MVRAVGNSGYTHQPHNEGNKPSKQVSNLSSKVTEAVSNVYIKTNSKALNPSRVTASAPNVSEKVNQAVTKHGKK